MHSKKILNRVSFISLGIVICIFSYVSLAVPSEEDKTMVDGQIEDEFDQMQDDIIGDEGQDEVVDGQETDENIVEEEIEEEIVEFTNKTEPYINSSLPEKVGDDVSKDSIKKGDFPILPGFEVKDNVLVGTVKNVYKTEVRVVNNGKVVTVILGSEVQSDKLLQGVVSQIISFYKGSYEFKLNGNYSKLIIKL